MSESSILVKFVVIVGLLMVLIAALYPGANTAWSTFSTAVTTGPNLPSWQNPNGLISQYHDLVPSANNSVGTLYQPYYVNSCMKAQYWVCVYPFGPVGSGTSTVSLPIAHNNFSYVANFLEGFNSNYQIAYIQAIVTCNVTIRSTATVWHPLVFNFAHGANNHSFSWFYSTYVQCPVGNVRSNVYSNDTQPSAQTGTLSLADFAASSVFVYLGGGTGDNVTISGINFVIGTTTLVSCIGGGLLNANAIACQIGNFVTQVVMFFATIGSGIVFVISFIVAVLGFLWTVFTGILIGFAGSMYYFLALPGAPSWVQGIVDAFFIGGLFVFFLVLAGYATGLFGGAVNKA